MKEPQHNQLNWLHVYYVCRYFICLNMDLIMQTGAKQSEFQAVGGAVGEEGGGRKEVVRNHFDVLDEFKDTDVSFICDIHSWNSEQSIPNLDFHFVSPITIEIITII